MPTNEQYITTWTNPDAILGMTIDEFLGRGLGYAQWKIELEARRLTWNANLRNTIIDREFLYFMSEIEQLLAEPNIAQGTGTKSNSLASILKRLKGEVWVEGKPAEEEERRRTRRLYGKDAK